MLKTDYKDDEFTGDRKYKITSNEDGTSGINDVTTYLKEGDTFGAEDINTTNKAVNALYRGVIVQLPASGWSLSAPYSQTVSVAGLKSTDAVTMGKAATKDTGASTAKTWDKMMAMITAAEAKDGEATFYCVSKKPTSDFSVKLRGVSADE